MSIFTRLTFICLLLAMAGMASAQQLSINDLSYFEGRGANVFVFNNEFNGFFFDEKTSGIEFIHHGVRTVQGGAIRLQNTPEQWDLIPTVINRKVDKTANTIEVDLKIKELDFSSKVQVQATGDGIIITVILDTPLPSNLEGKAGFNLEFLPSAYFEKSYLADGKPGYFPLYPSGETVVRPISEKITQFAGHTTFDDRGRGEFLEPLPMATCNNLVLAPEDPERRITLTSETPMRLFDGRNLAQNGWFVVRSLLPAGKTGNVLQWKVKLNTLPNWLRTPVIAFSQAGYVPDQQKVAVIELDKNDTPLKQASLYKIDAGGQQKEVMVADVLPWGRYLRYNYVKFDFSTVKEPGLYVIKYGENRTNPFSIDATVYDNIWHPTQDVWFPVQMDHMEVNEAYRIWHGVPYLDDAVQAPVNHQHFDGYSMGPVTDTKFKPYERIPGLAVGGWFDAGDFDIQTGSHNSVLLDLSAAWERFRADRDETYIDQQTRYVDIHRPDQKPDILQQIEHGTLNVVAQLVNIGHPVRGIIVPNLHQYHHLGDASTETDNLPYNPALKPYETDGKSSGTPDDRWAFTNRITTLDYHSIAALASASRVLKDFNPQLATDCMVQAKRLWEEDKNRASTDDTVFGKYMTNTEVMAALQLYITTKDAQYAVRFKEMIWKLLDQALNSNIATALQAVPYLDDAYRINLKPYVAKFKDMNDNLAKENPYGVPISARGWAGNTQVINWAITNYYAHQYYPELVGKEYVFKGLDYILGCHPYSNISFVSTVGAKSKKITYGNNRADFRFIAGGIVPGVLLLKPDFLENKEDWPFLWGENECVVDTGAGWILLSQAVHDLISK